MIIGRTPFWDTDLTQILYKPCLRLIVTLYLLQAFTQVFRIHKALMYVRTDKLPQQYADI